MDHDHDLIIPVSKRKKQTNPQNTKHWNNLVNQVKLWPLGPEGTAENTGVNVATLNRALREQAWLAPLWGGVCALRHHLGGEEGKEEHREPVEGAARVSGWTGQTAPAPAPCRLFLSTPPRPDLLTPIPGPAHAPHPDAPTSAPSASSRF